MSQEAVERMLGRLITDAGFRTLACDSLEVACCQEGYFLTSTELRLLADLDFQQVAAITSSLDPGLCRASGEPQRSTSCA
jgi:hypothetical protein